MLLSEPVTTYTADHNVITDDVFVTDREDRVFIAARVVVAIEHDPWSDEAAVDVRVWGYRHLASALAGRGRYQRVHGAHELEKMATERLISTQPALSRTKIV